MKPKIFGVFLLVNAIFVISSFAHPIKLTSSLLEYNPDNKRMVLQCRVFIDDFINTINKQDFDATDLSKEDIAEVECYFWESYRITVNGIQRSLDYQGSKAHLAFNVLDLQLTVNDVTIEEGDRLLIENVLFFGKFGIRQSNKMIVRIPPFIAEDHYETTFRQYVVFYEL